MTTSAPPTAPQILTVTFEPVPAIRRVLEVRTPDEGQLAVWAASGERFQSLGQEWAEAEEALKDLPEDHPEVLAFREQRSRQAARALSRALRIIGSALAHQADRDWVEDCLLERRFQLGDALGIWPARWMRCAACGPRTPPPRRTGPPRRRVGSDAVHRRRLDALLGGAADGRGSGVRHPPVGCRSVVGGDHLPDVPADRARDGRRTGRGRPAG
jgi:hypothetical protein